MTQSNAKFIIVPLTDDLRLTTDGAQYIIQRRRVIDPTRAPNYTPPADGSVPDIREEWENERYYGLRAEGLVSAIGWVAHVTASSDGGETELSEYAERIRADYGRLCEKVGAWFALGKRAV